MTVINITGLERLLGAPGPIATGTIQVTYWAGGRAYVAVDGATVTFPKPVVVRIVDGDPAETIDLDPTNDVCCVKWVVSANGYNLSRYTSIPDTGPIDFGDLEDVDPALFTPVTTPNLSATVQALIAQYAYDRF